jgi:RNA polymerase sigma-54 factor
VSLGPRLDLRQSQALVMTPQLQQAIKLLALSNLELEAHIADAVAANPLLEMTEPEGEAMPPPGDAGPGDIGTAGDALPGDQPNAASDLPADPPLDVEPASAGPGLGTTDGDWGSPLRGESGDDPFDPDTRAGEAESLTAHLQRQIGLTAADHATALVAGHLIGLLDETGYLTSPLEEIAIELGIETGQVEAALGLVQTLDPTGVGARSLAECIALQAREADRYDPCMARLIDNLDLLARGEIPRLKRMCAVDDEDFADMLAELRSYDPRPGLRFAGGEGAPITPDVLLAATPDGGWSITLNPATLPKLVVNRAYYSELRGACADRTARSWLAERLTDANWLVRALDQRQKTILKVTEEIVRHQDLFFRHGVAHLRPLTLRAVAEAIDMHESTVSRVTSNKHLMCDRGTFELKYFFSSGVASSAGDGAVSAEAVKAAIRSLIDAEKPTAILSDDALVELLRVQGFDLARRTVAKYREAIGLGSSIERRRRKAIAGVL